MTAIALPNRYSLRQVAKVDGNGRQAARKFVVSDSVSQVEIQYTDRDKAVGICGDLNSGLKRLAYGTNKVISGKLRFTGRPRKDEERRLVENDYQGRLEKQNLSNLSAVARDLIATAEAHGLPYWTGPNPTKAAVCSLRNILNMFDVNEVCPDQRTLDFVMDILDVWFEEHGV